jgi:hypothetical protein
MPETDVDGWYLAAVRYFRGLGFFARSASMKDEELSAMLKAMVSRQWDVPFPEIGHKDHQAADMCLLMADGDRVWYQDLECVLPGERSYISALQRWSAISGGAFNPENITETWHGNGGPVDMAFTLNGSKYTFRHGGGDMMDMSVIRMVNGLIKSTGYSFEVCDNLGMPNFVVALDKGEKSRLVKERRWKFVELLSHMPI